MLTSLRFTLLKILGFAFLVNFLACKEPPLALLENKDGCWEISNPLDLSVTVEAPRPTLMLEFELGQDYPYQNLYIKLSWDGPEGKHDTLLLDQFVSPVGEWMVPPSGGVVNRVFQDGFALPVMTPGSYNLRIQHFMRDDRLCEVNSVSIRLIP